MFFLRFPTKTRSFLKNALRTYPGFLRTSHEATWTLGVILVIPHDTQEMLVLLMQGSKAPRAPRVPKKYLGRSPEDASPRLQGSTGSQNISWKKPRGCFPRAPRLDYDYGRTGGSSGSPSRGGRSASKSRCAPGKRRNLSLACIRVCWCANWLSSFFMSW